MEQQAFDITKHVLVPEHIRLNEEEKKKLLTQYNISVKQLPQIKLSDPAIKHLTPKIGDVIKIKRPSATVGETAFYRIVING